MGEAQHSRWAFRIPLIPALMAALVVACDDDDDGGSPEPPGAVTVTVATEADSVVVTWTESATASSYRAELRAEPDTLRKNITAPTRMALFKPGDGLEDEIDYEVVVFAIGDDGLASASTPQTVSTNFFPWDEYYPGSLHFTRAGKDFFYGASPNNGYEALTGVAYQALPCQECHRPDQAPGTRGCESCHDTSDPGLGAEIEASLSGPCGGCHSRQQAERAQGYTDAHDAVSGGDCMFCHSLEDVHGDATTYDSMLEDGAIDAKCADCHSEGNVPGPPTTNTYHAMHEASVDCSTCHMQSVVTCNNCHLGGQIQVPPVKMARSQIKDWMFLLNRNGKVSPGNFQSLEFQGETFVAIAPFYSHTIARDAVTACTDCHGNANVLDLDADSILKVVELNPSPPDFDTKGVGTTGKQGYVPIPFNYMTALRFDFLHFDDATGKWEFVEEGPDGFQILFAEPLTDAQLTRIVQ